MLGEAIFADKHLTANVAFVGLISVVQIFNMQLEAVFTSIDFTTDVAFVFWFEVSFFVLSKLMQVVV